MLCDGGEAFEGLGCGGAMGRCKACSVGVLSGGLLGGANGGPTGASASIWYAAGIIRVVIRGAEMRSSRRAAATTASSGGVQQGLRHESRCCQETQQGAGWMQDGKHRLASAVPFSCLLHSSAHPPAHLRARLHTSCTPQHPLHLLRPCMPSPSLCANPLHSLPLPPGCRPAVPCA